MLKPIEKPNVSTEIIKQILSELRSGVLKPGDKLPTERELGELLHVGRGSIREALKALEAVGLIKRTTEGTTLCEPGETESPGLILGGCCAEIHEVFDTRKLMEIEIAGLAAQRAAQEEIGRIGETIIKPHNVEEIQAMDTAFHRAIVKAAKNAVLSQVYHLVTGLLFQTHQYYSLMGVKEPLESFTKKIITGL